MRLLDRDTSRKNFGEIERLRAIPAGAHVAFNMPNGRPLAEALWESWKAGHVIVPVDPRWPATKKAFVLEHSEAEYVVSDMEGLTPEGHVAELGVAAHQPDMSRRIILYTSGSTGDPKGVMLSRRAIMDNCYGMSERFVFDHQHNAGTCLPLWHVNALYLLIATQSTGCWLLIHPNTDVTDYFEELGYWDCKVAFIVPSLIDKVLEAKPRWPKRLEYFVTAASALSATQAARWADLYGGRTLVQGYGSTEGGNFLFVMPRSVQIDGEAWARAVEAGNSPSVGVPLRTSYEFRIMMQDGVATQTNLVGEVQVRNKSTMSGYWKNPKATDEVMIGDGWLRTGDDGYVDSDRQLRLIGRSKELVKRGGASFWPSEVEEFWESCFKGTCFPVKASDGTETMGGAFTEEPVKVCKIFDTPRKPAFQVATSWGYTRGIDDEVYVDAEFSGDLPEKMESIPTMPAEYSPDYVLLGDVERTSTGKPQRLKTGLAARVVTVHGYQVALSAQARAAHAICRKQVDPERPCTQAARVTIDMAEAVAREIPDPGEARGWDTAVEAFYDALAREWDDLAESYDGAAFLKSHRGLWASVMNGPLMGSYGKLCAQVAMDLMSTRVSGKALELGAGTANTTRWVVPPSGWEYVASDIDQGLLGGKGIKVDVDEPIPGDWDVVVATNVLHCARDPQASLESVYQALNPGGWVVIAEGNPRPGGVAHAIEILCSGLAGWMDRGGFRERAWWILALSKAGFEVRGWSKIRSGKYDIGGAIWAQKKV